MRQFGELHHSLRKPRIPAQMDLAWRATPDSGKVSIFHYRPDSMNQIELLKIFLRVSELSSFTQAAHSLGLPKANVSDAIRALEEMLGTRLLHRTTRKVQSTHDGAALYERAKDIVAEVDELAVMFRRSAAALSGRLRVDLPTVVAQRIVVPRMHEFLAQHPLLEVELSSTDRRVDVVQEGFDCVMRAGELHDSTLVVKPLGAMRLANFASPAYLQKHGIPTSLDDLEHHRLIHYMPVFGSRSPGFEYVEDGVRRFVPMHGNMTVNNVDAYEVAAIGGLGLIQAPLGMLRSHLTAGRLVTVLPTFSAAPLEISLLYASRRLVPERVRLFMGWLTELMAPEFE
jgi:DNA-binding transcriptional LysR family regulator